VAVVWFHNPKVAEEIEKQKKTMFGRLSRTFHAHDEPVVEEDGEDEGVGMSAWIVDRVA